MTASPPSSGSAAALHAPAGNTGAPQPPAAASGPVLELRGVAKSFGSTAILRGVDLQLQRGERLALIGPNGAGKSTLFNLISGLHAPSAGTIELNGTPIHALAPCQIYRRGLARSFQISNLFPTLSVFDNLRCAVLWNLGHRYAFWKFLDRLDDARQRAEDMLHELDLHAQRKVRAADLSYAQQRALELGLTLAGGSHLLLLDEPTAGMSRSETLRFVQLIRRVTQDKTLLMVEHDMGVVWDLADRIAVLDQGRVIACGTPAQVRADPAVQAAYLGPAAAPA